MLEGHVSLSIKQKILRDGKEGCARETQEGETGDAPPAAEKASPFRGRPRFPGAKRTETGWADGVFLHHAGRKNFFDTLSVRPQTRAGAEQNMKKEG